MASSSRALVGCLALCAGACGSFWDRPQDSFRAQLLAPAVVAERTVADSDKPRDCWSGDCLAAGAPVVTCGISDAVVPVRLKVQGCERSNLTVFDYADDPRNLSSSLNYTGVWGDGEAILTTAVDLAVATRNRPPLGFVPNSIRDIPFYDVSILSAVASCSEDPRAVVEIPFVVKVDGLERGDYVGLEMGKIQRVVPLTSGALVVASEHGVKCLSQFDGDDPDSPWLHQSGAVQDVQSFGDFGVVFKRLDDETFRGSVAIVERCSGHAMYGGPQAALQQVDAVSRLGSERLALVGRAPDESLALVITDLLLQDAQVHALPNSTGSVVHATGTGPDGALVLVYASLADGLFQKAEVSPASGEVEIEALPPIGVGALPTKGFHLWTAPDASYFVYGWETTYGMEDWGFAPLHARGIQEAADRWTVSGIEVNEVAFAGGTVLLPHARGLRAIDSASGGDRWSYDIPPVFFHAPDRSHVQVLADALVYSNQTLVENAVLVGMQVGSPWLGRTATLSLDGELRYTQPDLPNGIQLASLLTADEQGRLYSAATDSTLVRLTLANGKLEAPPARCSLVDCGTGEVDLSSDPANCHFCGMDCASHFSKHRCVAGQCVD